MGKFTEFEAFCPLPLPAVPTGMGHLRAGLLIEDWGRRFGTTYRLTAPLLWDIGCKGSGWVLAISEGTTFDISVPSWLTWALSPHDRRVLPAAAIHDALLEAGHDAAFASAEFRRACIARGVSRPFAWLLFTAVFVWTVAISPQAEAATS